MCASLFNLFAPLVSTPPPAMIFRIREAGPVRPAGRVAASHSVWPIVVAFPGEEFPDPAFS